MSKILITGITGFVGSHLAEYLIGMGHEVHGFFRPRSDFKNIFNTQNKIEDKIIWHECDLMDTNTVYNTVGEINPSYVFHLAAQSDVAYSFKNSETTLSNNIIGELNLLDALVAKCPRARLHIAGSSEEYGDVQPEEFPIKESQPLRPLSPYAVSKVAQEHLALQYHRSYGIWVVVTRAFNHTGPRRGSNFAESSWAKQLVEGNTVEHGNLDSYRDYTDVRDVVRAYWLAITKGKPGEVYNVCSGITWGMKEILDMLQNISGRKIVNRKQDPNRMRPSDLVYLLGDSTKLKVQTGWKPEIEIKKTMTDLFNYWKKYAI